MADSNIKYIKKLAHEIIDELVADGMSRNKIYKTIGDRIGRSAHLADQNTLQDASQVYCKLVKLQRGTLSSRELMVTREERDAAVREAANKNAKNWWKRRLLAFLDI